MGVDSFPFELVIDPYQASNTDVSPMYLVYCSANQRGSAPFRQGTVATS